MHWRSVSLWSDLIGCTFMYCTLPRSEAYNIAVIHCSDDASPCTHQLPEEDLMDHYRVYCQCTFVRGWEMNVEPCLWRSCPCCFVLASKGNRYLKLLGKLSWILAADALGRVQSGEHIVSNSGAMDLLCQSFQQMLDEDEDILDGYICPYGQRQCNCTYSDNMGNPLISDTQHWQLKLVYFTALMQFISSGNDDLIQVTFPNNPSHISAVYIAKMPLTGDLLFC